MLKTGYTWHVELKTLKFSCTYMHKRDWRALKKLDELLEAHSYGSLVHSELPACIITRYTRARKSLNQSFNIYLIGYLPKDFTYQIREGLIAEGKASATLAKMGPGN